VDIAKSVLIFLARAVHANQIMAIGNAWRGFLCAVPGGHTRVAPLLAWSIETLNPISATFVRLSAQFDFGMVSPDAICMSGDHDVMDPIHSIAVQSAGSVPIEGRQI
jgi:hypothetical protein